MEKHTYAYPFRSDWTVEEITKVLNLWRGLERVYESGMETGEFLLLYQGFKEVVPSKSEEKQLARDFERLSGYALYPAVKKASESKLSKIKMS